MSYSPNRPLMLPSPKAQHQTQVSVTASPLPTPTPGIPPQRRSPAPASPIVPAHCNPIPESPPALNLTIMSVHSSAMLESGSEAANSGSSTPRGIPLNSSYRWNPYRQDQEEHFRIVSNSSEGEESGSYHSTPAGRSPKPIAHKALPVVPQVQGPPPVIAACDPLPPSVATERKRHGQAQPGNEDPILAELRVLAPKYFQRHVRFTAAAINPANATVAAAYLGSQPEVVVDLCVKARGQILKEVFGNCRNPAAMEPIVSVLVMHADRIATDRLGCVALNAMLDAAGSGSLLSTALAERVLQQVFSFAHGAESNFVVSALIRNGTPSFRRQIAHVFSTCVDDFIPLCNDKAGTHVVEAFVSHAENDSFLYFARETLSKDGIVHQLSLGGVSNYNLQSVCRRVAHELDEEDEFLVDLRIRVPQIVRSSRYFTNIKLALGLKRPSKKAGKVEPPAAL